MDSSSKMKMFILALTMTALMMFVFNKWALLPLDGDLTKYTKQGVGDTVKGSGLKTTDGQNGHGEPIKRSGLQIKTVGKKNRPHAIGMHKNNKKITLPERPEQNEKDGEAINTTGILIEQDPIGMNQSTTENPLSKGQKYMLDNEYCRIPYVDPFDTEDTEMGKVTCTGRPSITYVEGSYLKLNWTRVTEKHGDDFKYCQYMNVLRIQGTDFKFSYGNVSEKFIREIRVPPDHEYIRVYCYSQSENLISTTFHAAVTPKKDVEERSDILFKKHVKQNKPKETFNVLFLGLDSVSRLNYVQRMPRTREYLLNELSGFEMKGYTKLADNTFPNVVPLTTGKFIHEFGGRDFLNRQFDRHDFFWKNFSRAGYRTMYAEDAPGIAIFVYAKPGFKNPPADYYNRHLQLALEEERSIWNSNHHCFGDKMESKYLLDYISDYSRVFTDKPHFAFVFITRLSHNLPSLLAAADEPYLEFLKRFKSEGRLKNTIIVLFGDHGIRFGTFRNSYRGKIQDRLPMMNLVFPRKFHEKYPHLVRNLRANTKRLTTPLDIYETVKDIINFDGLDKKANIEDRGISLLREIPKERTCDHAKINPHWCMCMGEERMNTTTPLAAGVGRGLIKILNKILTPETDKCATLSLGNITGLVKKTSSARLSKGTILQDQFERHVARAHDTNAPLLYQITLSTLPSNALFEATLFYDKGTQAYQLVGDIGRLNMYGDQSRCVSNYKLKLFCFCK